MKLRPGYILLLFFICISFVSLGQKVYFNGLGRALITNSALNGNILRNDTATPNRETDGYVFFDMGVNFQPYDYLRGKAVVRLKNKFGVFFGQGASVELRQILIEGIIAKKVRYAIGDMNISMTPYTLYNYSNEMEGYDPDVFMLRRDIVYYENFNIGNTWRLQGAKADATLLFKESSSRIKINAFASRTKPTNYYSSPDRFLMGASVLSYLGNVVELGVNYVNFFNLRSQISTDSSSYKNEVVTSNLKLTKKTGAIKLMLSGEGGYSFNQNNVSVDSVYNANDYFFDVKGEVKLKPYDIGVYATYKHVGTVFSSPGAQTLRIDAGQVPSLFPKVFNNEINRSQLLFDRLTDPDIYNQTIRPELMYYYPYYGNAQPYGSATPNRTGPGFGATAGTKNTFINSFIRSDFLREIEGVGSDELRKFFILQGGTVLRFGKIFNSSRIYELTGSFRLENTERNGQEPIELRSNQASIGVSAETIKNLDLMAGFKFFKAQGKEYIISRNRFNEPVGFTPFEINAEQRLMSVGLRYRFSEKSFFAFTANYSRNVWNSNPENNYQLIQYFVNYSVTF